MLRAGQHRPIDRAISTARTPGTWWYRWKCADCGGRTSHGQWGFAGLAEQAGRHHWRAKHGKGI